MSYADKLAPIGAEADAEVSVLTTDKAALTTSNLALTADNAVLTSTNAVLRSERDSALAEVQRLRDLYEHKAILGVSRPDNSAGFSGSTAAERTFLTPGQKPVSLAQASLMRNAVNRLEPGGTIWLSIKDRAGTWFDSLLDDIETKRPDVKIVATANHEPFDNYNFRNAAEWGAWESLQDSFEAVLEDHPAVVGVTIVEAFHVPSRTPGYFDAVVRDAQRFGADSYNPGMGSPGRYVPVAEVHGELTEWTHDVKGHKLYIGETGVGLVENTVASAVGRSQWVRDNREYMLENADLACWWNSGGPGPMDSCRLPLADLQAWLAH